jgi:hypothetical protein
MIESYKTGSPVNTANKEPEYTFDKLITNQVELVARIQSAALDELDRDASFGENVCSVDRLQEQVKILGDLLYMKNCSNL